ncbi:hypothetical protein GW17_00056005, partial [Ensete ventricosum]
IGGTTLDNPGIGLACRVACPPLKNAEMAPSLEEKHDSSEDPYPSTSYFESDRRNGMTSTKPLHPCQAPTLAREETQGKPTPSTENQSG